MLLLRFKNDIMFYLIQKYKSFQLVLIIGLLGILGFQFFTSTEWLTNAGLSLPYATSLQLLLVGHKLLSQSIVLCLLIVQLILLSRFFMNSNLIESRTFLPAVWLLIFFVGGNFFLPLSASVIINFSVVLLLLLHSDYSDSNIKNKVLLSGILIGVASLYDISALLLIMYVIFSAVVNRYNKFRDIIIVFVGLLIPYIYVVAYHYFIGDLADLLDIYAQFRFSFPLFVTLRLSYWSIAAISVFVVSIIYIIIRLKLLFDNKLIVARKKLLSLNLLFISVVVMFFTTNVTFPQSFSYFLVPLSVLFPIYVEGKRFSIMREILITVITLAIIAIGWQL